jgi:hypothetical protein
MRRPFSWFAGAIWHRLGSPKRQSPSRYRTAEFELLSRRQALAADLTVSSVNSEEVAATQFEPNMIGLQQPDFVSSVTEFPADRGLEGDMLALTIEPGREAAMTPADGQSGQDISIADGGAASINAVSVVSSVASPLWGEAFEPVESGNEPITSSGGGGGDYGGGYGQMAPVIYDFVGRQGPGGWTFTGRVEDDELVAGLEVRFGGLLANQSATVQADGSFSITVYLPPGTLGTVTAIVTDYDGLDSEEVSYVIW